MAVSMQSYTNDLVFSFYIRNYVIQGLTANAGYTVALHSVIYRSDSWIPLTNLITLNLTSTSGGTMTIYNLRELIEAYMFSHRYSSYYFRISVTDHATTPTTNSYRFRCIYSHFRIVDDVSKFDEMNFARLKRVITCPRDGYLPISLFSSTGLDCRATYYDLDDDEVKTGVFALTASGVVVANANISPALISSKISANHILRSYNIYSGDHSLTVYVSSLQTTHCLLFLNNWNAWQCLCLHGVTKRRFEKSQSEAVCNEIISHYDIHSSILLDVDAFVPHYLESELHELINSKKIYIVPLDTDFSDALLTPSDYPELLLSGHTFEPSDEGTDATTVKLQFKYADPRDPAQDAFPLDGIFTEEYAQEYS